MRDRSSLWKTFLNLITSFRKSEYTVTITLAIFIGVLGGFGAIGFRLLIRTFQSIFYGTGPDLVEIVSSIPWYWKILIPAMGGAVVGPLIFFLVVGMLKRTDMIVAYNNAVLRRSIERG